LDSTIKKAQHTLGKHHINRLLASRESMVG